MLALLRGRAETWEETGAQLLTPPAWMMLKWTCQLLALLNEPHGECVAPLLERLAAAYPAARMRRRRPGPRLAGSHCPRTVCRF